MDMDDKNKFRESYISKENLITVLKNIALNFGETTLGNHELENFLSSFKYNKLNNAKVDDIVNSIYE